PRDRALPRADARREDARGTARARVRADPQSKSIRARRARGGAVLKKLPNLERKMSPDAIDTCLAKLTNTEMSVLADRLVDCACGAQRNEACKELARNTSPIARRLKRLLHLGTLEHEETR